MASTNQGDAAVERLDNAVTAFEQIMTGPEGQTVQVPGYQPQPTLAERVKQNLKPSTDAAAGFAAQAAASASAAKVSETNSKASEIAVEADRSEVAVNTAIASASAIAAQESAEAAHELVDGIESTLIQQATSLIQTQEIIVKFHGYGD